MQNTAGEEGQNNVMSSYGPLHTDGLVLVNHQELTNNISVLTQDAIQKTYLERWMIGKNTERERERERIREIHAGGTTWWWWLAILNKSWRQHPTKHQLYGHLPPIMKTIQVRRTRHAGHCRRSRDELISDVLLWTLIYGRAKPGWPARTYIQQLCKDMGCSLEDLPEAMNDWEKWRERVRDIRASSATWWWWYIYVFVLMLTSSWRRDNLNQNNQA